MGIKKISAIDAASLFHSNSDALYVDVRTVAEFSKGHPKLQCVNIPIFFRYPIDNRVIENDAFALVTGHTLTDINLVVVGSARNSRAQIAAEILATSGYAKIQLLVDGYSGWMNAEMPSTGDNRDGVSYASLLTRARRERKKVKN